MSRARLGWQSTLSAHDISRQRARLAVAAAKRALPAQWAAGIDGLCAFGDQPLWMRDVMVCDAMRAFMDKHKEAVRWCLSDSDLCQRARVLADDVAKLLEHDTWMAACGAAQTLQGRIDVVLAVCDAVGVEPPRAVLGEAAVARACCARWWRRTLRRHVARVVELGAIRLGLVSKDKSCYASDEAVQRRMQQQARNAGFMAASAVRNEAGQVLRLSTVAAASVSNPEIRRAELMQRISGADEYAKQRGHVGVFFTLTAPSRFHSVNTGADWWRAKSNRSYDGSSPRDAQEWLRKCFQRARAAWARMGLQPYGLRVAEPHGDGCPHWHMLAFFEDECAAMQAHEALRHYWLQDAGNEPGAQTSRVQAKALTSGGAAAYVAKYVAKNMIGNGLVQEHLDMDESGRAVVMDAGAYAAAQRVDAWASTWGIRQFQFFGMPPVGVWRMLRRVSSDQRDAAQLAGECEVVRALHAVHRAGAVLACWRSFMEAAGQGAGLAWQVPGRRAPCRWRFAIAARKVERKDAYGGEVTRQLAYGVRAMSGLCLIGRRQQWEGASKHEADAYEALPQAEKARIARPWSGFNNCTARVKGAALDVLAQALGLRGAGDLWRRPSVCDGRLLV